MRRHKVLKISGQLLFDMLKRMQNGEQFTINGLPPDATLEDARWDFDQARLDCLVRSESFAEVPPNAFAPELEIVVSEVRP